MKRKINLYVYLVLLIAIFIAYEFYTYFNYRNNSFDNIPEVKIEGNMTITHKELSDKEYIIYNNIKFENIFDGFERVNEESNVFKMMKSDKSQAIFVGSEKQLLYLLINNDEYNDVLSSVIESEKIKDDIDLLKYLERHNNDKVRVFMSTKKQKEIYTLNEFKANVLPSLLSVKIINGYYNGYLFKTNEKIIEANIIKNNETYYFTFIGDYSESFINDFLNSVVIN